MGSADLFRLGEIFGYTNDAPQDFSICEELSTDSSEK